MAAAVNERKIQKDDNIVIGGKLTSKTRIIQIKKHILTIVEAMLEENIAKDWFLENCIKLCQADYDDVIEERSIEHMCGYPMCSRSIEKGIKQQYRISANKVYDITQRKNFCSNQCYKASNFLKSQLHTLPLYMRKNEESSSTVKLLSDSNNSGSAGEELVFHQSITEKEIEEKNAEILVSSNLSNMLQEDIKDCVDHLADLEIKENVYRNKYVYGIEDPNMLPDDANNGNYDELGDSEVSDSEDKLFQDYDNLEVLCNKHMPIPGKAKKTVLILPLKATKTLSSSPTKLPVDFIAKVFQDWFTEDTMKYLLGERQVYSIRAEQLFKTMVITDQSPEELSSMKEEYISLCLKIDKLPEEEEEISDTPETDICELCPAEKTEAIQKKLEKLAEGTDSKSVPIKKNPKRRTKRSSPGKRKSVSFASNVKPGNDIPKDTDSASLPEPTLPLVDSLSQNTLRRQVLMGRLKSVYSDVLSVVELRYRDIKEEVKAVVDTFSLTPTNIIYKPKQFKCIAVVLFRVLTKTKLKELHEDSQFTKLCENSLTVLNISHQDVESLACDLVSPYQVLRLQRS